jgi:hypothetical protein
VTPSITQAEIENMRSMVASLNLGVDLDDIADRIFNFLTDLSTWLSRHEGHDIHIGSDYSTELANLDEYRNESMDGKVSVFTRYEARCKSISEWRQTAVNEIKRVIANYGLVDEQALDQMAAELYEKFSMKGI